MHHPDIMNFMSKKKNKRINSGQIIIPNGHPSPPTPNEMNVALVLSRHYQTTVEFIVPVDDYKRKSADVLMQDVVWEIKCPIGASKSTIRNQFRRASKQSKCIIIDIRQTKLNFQEIEKSILFEIRERPYIKKVVLIDKSDKVIEFQI